MRPENAQSAKYTAAMVGPHFMDYVLDEEDLEILDRKSRENFRKAEQAIKDLWKTSPVAKDQDGYILFQDNIYKVRVVNGQVTKITGNEARDMKKRIRSHPERTREVTA